MKTNKLKMLILTFSLVLVLVGFSPIVSAVEQVLKIGVDMTDIYSMSILDNTQSQDGTFRAAIYEKLVDYAVPGQVSEDMVPKLAVSWEQSDDYKRWVFKLREGVQFHHGYGEMTAEDVKYTIDQLRNPEISAYGARIHFKTIEEVNVLDDYTVEVLLNSPEPRFISKIGQDAEGILITSKKAMEELGDSIKTNPVGTGPFQFAEYKPNDYAKMVRFDDYWGDKKAMLDAVVIYYMPNTSARNVAIENGDVHIIRGVYDAIWRMQMEQAGMTFDMLGPGFSSMLFFNTRIKPLDNKLVREAIAYAIDREEIGAVFGAESQLSPVPSSWLFHTTEGVISYDHDLEKAKAKLAEAGYPNGLKIGPQYISESTFYKNQFEVLQAQLAEAGIDLDMVIVDHTTFHNNQYEGIQPLPLYGNGNFDGQTMFFTFFHSNSEEMNFAHYNAIDDLLDSSLAKTTDEITEIIGDAQRKVMEDLVVFPTVEVGIPAAIRPEVELGYDPIASIIGFYPVTVDTHLKD